MTLFHFVKFFSVYSTEVRCEKLNKPSIGHFAIAAKKCDEQSQMFDTICEIMCPDGYHMHPGPKSIKSNAMICSAENGTWTGNQRVCKGSFITNKIKPIAIISK